MSDLELWIAERRRRSDESGTSIAGFLLVVLEARLKAETAEAKG